MIRAAGDLDKTPRHVVAAVAAAVFRGGFRNHRIEPPVKVQPVPAGHQGRLDALPFFRQITRGKTDEQVRRPPVRLYGVCVKMLRGNSPLILEQHRLGPVDEIARCAGHDGAYTVDERAVILAVLKRVCVPKGEVLRIKRALGDHRFIPCQLPADAVGRLENIQAGFPNRAASGDAFVARLGRTVRIAILERHKTMCAKPIENNVVFFRAVKLEQAKFRLHPVNAVAALGVASHLAMCLLFRLGVPMGCPIVHPEQIAIAKDRVIRTGVSLPRRVGDEHNFPRLRLVQKLFCAAGHRCDEVSIDEQLALRAVLAKRQRFSDRRKLRRKQQRKNKGNVTICFHGVQYAHRDNFKSIPAKNPPCRWPTPPAFPPAVPIDAP